MQMYFRQIVILLTESTFWHLYSSQTSASMSLPSSGEWRDSPKDGSEMLAENLGIVLVQKNWRSEENDDLIFLSWILSPVTYYHNYVRQICWQWNNILIPVGFYLLKLY